MASPEPKAWTLLAYTVADDKGGLSPLDEPARNEVKAICAAADLGRMHVALQVDFRRTAGVFRATLRPRISRDFRDANPEKYDLWRDVVKGTTQSDLELQKERKDLNAASGGVLQQFLQYGRERCPARRYVIFFYGHAFGPMGLFYDRAPGESAPSTLRLNTLASALSSEDGPAEVILFRDCFMDTLETACQLHGVARYIIATQAEAPIAGQWPWVSIMSALMESASSSDVAGALALQLAGHFDQKENRGPLADVPYSLIDIEAAQVVLEPMKSLTVALDASRSDPARRKECAQALERARLGRPDTPARPGDPALLDVPTMCDNLQKVSSDSIVNAARAVGDVTNRTIRLHHSQKGRFRGLSIYYKPVEKHDLERSFIQASTERDKLLDNQYYESLAMNQATGWHRVALDPLSP
jgi:hypothetical protein